LADELKAISFYQKLEAAKSSNVVLLRDYAETLDRAGETCLLNGTNKVAVEAKQLFQQSLGIWTEMRDRGTLSKADAHKPDEIAAEIAKCDAALK
jgi:hypothetical protein